MSEFTEGPWEVFENDDELMVIQSGSLESGHGWVGYLKIATELQGVEDARLIAAAPELLEACLRMRNQLYAAGYEAEKGSLNPTKCLLAQVESAIAKALGK